MRRNRVRRRPEVEMLESMTLLSSVMGDGHATMVPSAVTSHLPNPLRLKGILHGTSTYFGFAYGVYENGKGSLARIGHVTYSGSTGGSFDGYSDSYFTISSENLGSLSLRLSYYNRVYMYIIT
jgi:hypothetical protein